MNNINIKSTIFKYFLILIFFTILFVPSFIYISDRDKVINKSNKNLNDNISSILSKKFNTDILDNIDSSG